MDAPEYPEPVDEVNDAVFTSSLATLPSPTGAGVGRWSHIIEHDQHTIFGGIHGREVKNEVLELDCPSVLLSPFTGWVAKVQVIMVARAMCISRRE